MSETVEATETPSTPTTETKNTSSAQSQLSEEELKSQTDCYFYLHNNCTKGDRCEFRHSEAALATQAVCREWVLDNCPRGVDCPSRHPSKQTATTFKPKPYFKPAYSAPYHAPHYPSYHHAPPVDRSQTPCYYFLMGQCAKGAACPFSHQFVKAEDANKKSSEDTDKALKFSVKNDSAKEDRPSNNRNNTRDESSSNRSRDRDENSRHSDDSGRQRRPRQEANVVFELPNSRKHEQRARSNSDVKHNNNNNNRARDQHDNNRNKDQNNNGRKQVRQQERDSVNSVSFAASKEERQKQREQERAKAESGQKASFGVQRLSNLLPGQEAGTKRTRDSSAEEGPNKRRKVENGAAMSKDDLDRELDELNLPPPPASDGNDEELLDI